MSMTLDEYKELKRVKLIDSSFGALSRGYDIVRVGFGESYYEKVITYKEKDLPLNIIWGQMTKPIDMNNMVIIFTCHWIGSNRFFRKDGVEVLTDHCTFPIRIKFFLQEKGFRYKKKASLTDKNLHNNVAMIIIQNGIVYEIERNADPTAQFVWDDLQKHPIKPTPSDKITIEDKEIIMSGFFVKRFIKK